MVSNTSSMSDYAAGNAYWKQNCHCERSVAIQL